MSLARQIGQSVPIRKNWQESWQRQEPAPAATVFGRSLNEVELFLFLAGVASAQIYSQLGFLIPYSSWGEPVRVAESLVNTGVFGNPFAIETGPTAHTPPLFVAFLALVYKLTGDSFFVACTAITCVMHGLHAALLPRVSLRFFGSVLPGIFTAIVSVLFPIYKIMIGWEAMFVATGLMAFCLLSGQLMARNPASSRRSAIVAIVVVALVYMNPLSGVIVVGWLAFLTWRQRLHLATVLRFSLVFVVTLGGLILPWTVRNYLVLGEPVILRDDLGLALYASNNDCAEASLIMNIKKGCNYKYHPFGNAAEARLVAAMGEVAYNKARMADALRWIGEHRDRFFDLTLQRVRHFWFPKDELIVIIATLFGFAGLVLMIKDRLPLSLFILFVFLTYPSIYYIVEAQVRYRYPILWLSLLCCGYGVCQLWTHVRQRWSILSTPLEQLGR